MSTTKFLRVLIGICVISACVLGAVMPGAAETLNYKFCTWVIKSERVPVADVDGHTVVLTTRGAFYVFDGGEVATINHVSTADFVKGAGPFM
jgi:hypothetical protein